MLRDCMKTINYSMAYYLTRFL